MTEIQRSEKVKISKEKMIALIGSLQPVDLASRALQIYKVYEEGFLTAPGAKFYHCNFNGGLAVHTHNVIQFLTEICNEKELHEMIFLGFIHDLGKIMTYKFIQNYKGQTVPDYDSDIDHTYWTLQLLAKVNIVLDESQLNAIVYHHGGWSLKNQYIHPNRKAILLHCADMLAVNLEQAEGTR